MWIRDSVMFSYFLLIQPVLAMLGTPVLAKMDESSEKLNMAFDHPPPLFRKKTYCKFFGKFMTKVSGFICNESAMILFRSFEVSPKNNPFLQVHGSLSQCLTLIFIVSHCQPLLAILGTLRYFYVL